MTTLPFPKPPRPCDREKAYALLLRARREAFLRMVVKPKSGGK